MLKINPKFIALGCLLLLPTALWSQVWKSDRLKKEFGRSYTIQTDVVYSAVDSVSCRLDLYTPHDSSKQVPLLVWFHGGGWWRGSKDSISGQLAFYMTKGWVVANVEYRLAGAALAPAAVADCRCALRWLIDRAERYHIDATRIVVSGSSAGGHLALMTGMLPAGNPFDTLCGKLDLPPVAAIVDWYGIADVNDLLAGEHRRGYATRWLGDQQGRETVARNVSPLTYVRKGMPPVFMVHGDADTTVPYGQALRLRHFLDSAGVANFLYTVPGGYHGKWGKEKDSVIYTEIDRFLERIDLKK